MSLPPLVWDEFHAEHVPPDGMDALWNEGWRHFGVHFFRYSLMEHEGALLTVVPVRVDLSHFVLSKSQRRVLRRNSDVTVEIAPASLTNEACEMFHRHKTRFSDNVPEDLTVFLSGDPARVPCECLQLRCVRGSECVAVSFFDVGQRSISSVYAMFEPHCAERSLGIFSMLQEIAWAQSQGKQFAYPGYATLGRSHYDYKKHFTGLQGYDWADQCWKSWSSMSTASEQEGITLRQ
jgi:leucyl-tRNA---protein transferase